MDPFRSVFNAASKEKEDFVYLNDRLSDLFRKLEKMRGGGGDSCSQYLATIACLEEEIKKIRSFYEAEISKQRSIVSRGGSILGPFHRRATCPPNAPKIYKYNHEFLSRSKKFLLVPFATLFCRGLPV